MPRDGVFLRHDEVAPVCEQIGDVVAWVAAVEAAARDGEPIPETPAAVDDLADWKLLTEDLLAGPVAA